MEKFTTKSEKVRLNSDRETIGNHSIIKNIRKTQNFQRNTRDLFMFEQETAYH